MLYGLLVFLFTIVCVFLIIIILIQKGKSSMGMGSLGGGTQLLFGGSGGQDLFQKVTWTLGTIFMLGSLTLAALKEASSPVFKGITKQEKALTKSSEVKPAEPNKEVKENEIDKTKNQVSKTEENQPQQTQAAKPDVNQNKEQDLK